MFNIKHCISTKKPAKQLQFKQISLILCKCVVKIHHKKTNKIKVFYFLIL